MFQRFLKFFIFSMLTTNLLNASEEKEKTPQELGMIYLKTIGIEGEILSELTVDANAQDVFKLVYQSLLEGMKTVGRKQHDHVKSENEFGFSFLAKNSAPIQYIQELLCGEKSWTKASIEKTKLKIADMGCGLGFASFILLYNLATIYEHNGWVLEHPIELHLLDVVPEHQEAIQALAKLANTAYPQFFHVRSRVCDVSEPTLENNFYNIIFALNLVHYIPQTKWMSALHNITSSLKKNGLLFITADHYLSVVTHLEQKTDLESSVSTLEEPFFAANHTLFSKGLGYAKGTLVNNLNAIFYLKDGIEFIPGSIYQEGQINLAAFQAMLQAHCFERRKTTVALFTDASTREEISIKDILSGLLAERFIVRVGSYAFDDRLLEQAIMRYAPAGALKKIKAPWTSKLALNPHDYPASVGFTFVKN